MHHSPHLPHLPHFRSRWLIVPIISAAIVAGLLLILHALLNTGPVQKLSLKAISKAIDAEIGWQKMKFNGATGHFKGTNLYVNIPKTQSKFSLKNFELAINPLVLPFKKIHLINLEAEEIEIEIGGIRTSKKEVKGEGENIIRLLSIFSVDRADIKNFSLKLPEKKALRVGKASVRSELSVLTIKRKLNIRFDDVNFTSPKFDFFGDQIVTNGGLNAAYSYFSGRNEPEWDGKIATQSMLFAFNKNPNPTNPSPAWDLALDPVLRRYYLGEIPDNRAFLHVNDTDLSVFLSRHQFKINDGKIHLFDGILGLKGGWNRQNGEMSLDVKTPQKFRMALLPLGKSKIRQSFNHFQVALRLDGKFIDIHTGKLKGRLGIDLIGNRAKPNPDRLTLTLPLDFQNGKLNVKNLKGVLGDGVITGEGQIDLAALKLVSRFKGNQLDTQTIIRLFSSIDIPGLADTEGSITGSLKNPEFFFRIHSDDASYESFHMGAFDGELRIRDQNLNLKGNSRLGENGSGDLDLFIREVFRSSKQTVDLKTEFKNLPAGLLLNSKRLVGSVEGRFALKKQGQSYDGRGEVTARDILWSRIPIKQLTGGLELKDKTLTVRPITATFTDETPAVASSKPFTFQFGEEGTYRFEGTVLPNLSVKGERRAGDPQNVYFEITADKTPLDFLKPMIPHDIRKIDVGGRFEVTYHLPSPESSLVDASLTGFNLSGEEKDIQLIGKTNLEYEGKKIIFHSTSLKMGGGKIVLDGLLGFTEPSRLSIKGNLDLEQISGLVPWVSQGEGITQVDLTLVNPITTPEFEGKARFDGGALIIRNMRGELSDMKGNTRFERNRVVFDKFYTYYDDGPLFLNGWFEWETPYLTAADLTIRGTEISISAPDTWQILADADIQLKGSGGVLTLSGDLQVVDGLYYKDYSLSQFILKPVGVVRDSGDPFKSPFETLNFNLHVRSGGEFEIKNNLVDMALRGEMDLRGKYGAPILNGTIDVVDGQIHTMGIDFENATGFATFTPARGNTPFIEFAASHAIQDYEVTARIKGYSDNLSLTLESVPALNQNDIFSLVAYGETADQLTSARQNLFSTTAVASQVVGILQRPLSKATRLDIVKLETDPGDPDQALSRFSIGKKLSDRFSLAFTTDLSLEEAQKGVSLEYLIYDNILLKGIKDTGSRYRFDLTLRLEAY